MIPASGDYVSIPSASPRPRAAIRASTARTVTIGARELLFFGGCGYLGLAHDERVLQALGEDLRYLAPYSAGQHRALVALAGHPLVFIAAFAVVALGWTAGAGVEYLLGDMMSVKLEYRFLQLFDKDFTSFAVGNTEIEMNSHTIMTGVNWHF